MFIIFYGHLWGQQGTLIVYTQQNKFIISNQYFSLFKVKKYDILKQKADSRMWHVLLLLNNKIKKQMKTECL